MSRRLFFFISFLLLIILANAQDYCMKTPSGYGGNATGGGGGNVVTVKTQTELSNALKISGPAVIIVTENITFGEGEMIKLQVQNKTLLGMSGVRLISNAQVKNGGILQLNSGSNNVIIRNLIFEGPGAYDTDGNDLLQNVGCTNLWVDHCEFYDGVDGNFDNTKLADNITISWCKFGYNKPPKAGGSGGSNDHRFTNLVGGGENDAPTDGHYSITFLFCYWSDGCKERMPRARNAELHILNCYYNTDVSGSLALGLEGGVNGSTCYVEGTHYKKIGSTYKSYGSGTQNLTYTDCLGGTQTNIGTAPKPSYSYNALPANEVETAVTSASGAGATLVVNAGDGSVSSYASIRFPQQETERWVQTANDIRIENVLVKEMCLYDLSGKKVRCVSSASAISLNSLNKGLYIVSVLSANDRIFNKKIIVY
ncbi:MAG: T9SS type A sorting domain-containing protein [Dysgonamonadaceae bacterium]|jgi:pectate lyase|nr:T9SS type A sorting domain-containing protein [Dysgonamonadaceae bacterium]